jgi:hypothetical protein
MKSKLILLAIGCSMVLTVPALPAQDITTDSIYTNSNGGAFPVVVTLKYHEAVVNGRSLGEHALLPPGLKLKMKLTGEQRDRLKPFEDAFASTSRQYEAANQFKIDAAGEMSRRVNGSKHTFQIQAARDQSQAVWAGLDPERIAALKQIKPLLTPDQIAILKDPSNQWHENHVYEAHDPSAN